MQFTKDYQQILVDIFTKYDEKNLKTVPAIMKQFRQNKEQVIMHLCDRYNIDINALDGIDMSGGPAVTAEAPAVEGGEAAEAVAPVEGEEVTEGEEGVEEAPKKKSKVVMIIIIVVVLGALGGGGYFAYDMFMGSGSTDTEEVAPEEGAAEEVEPEPEAEPEPEPEPEVVDSLASDSTATDSTAADSVGAEVVGDGGE